MDQRISKNFEFSKIASIIMVATGHFFPGNILWVPVSIALFVFAFSSAIFTSEKYVGEFQLGKFWYRKIVRLGPDLLVINVFLLALFIFQGKPDIFTVDTIINMFGLSGFLNWFNIVNKSPFGGGLWFFTLLLIFYVAYPILNFISRTRISSIVLVVVALVATTYFHYTIHVGHVLWLTMFGFLFGVFYSKSGMVRVKLSPAITAAAGLLIVGLMIFCNYVVNFKEANYPLILAACVLTVIWLINAKVSSIAVASVGPVSVCLIEIYFIHTYLFVHPFESQLINYLASLAIIMSVAVLLERVARWVRGQLRTNERARATALR